MKYMPLFIDLHRRKVLMIGGGKVALRRGRQYVEAGANLTVIAPEILQELEALPGVICHRRGAEVTDVDRKFLLVTIASSDQVVNEAIAGECVRLDLLFNRSDHFEDGNFINGSIAVAGEIINATVAGGVPAISQYLQKRITEMITPELVDLAALLAEVRPAIKNSRLPAGSKQRFAAEWVNETILARLRAGEREKIRQEILACL